MAQHDFNIANQSFPSFRTDLNNALSAINTSQSGTSRPSGAVAGTIWLDTTSATTPTLKYYDGADDISLATLDHSANTVNWLDSTVSITGLSTTATGTVLTLSDTNLNSTVSIRIPTTKGIDDDSGNEFLKFTKTATAVNEFTIVNSATGSAPEIQSTGDDTDIDLKITPKGAGKIILDGLAFPNADGSASQVLQTNGSGVLSFATPSSGTNTPLFYAYNNANQTGLSQDTDTKLQANTEEYDIGGCYNNTGSTVTLNGISTPSYSFAPNVAGKYMLIGRMELFGASADDVREGAISFFKNDVMVNFNESVHNQSSYSFRKVVISSNLIVEANGTSDHFHLKGRLVANTSRGISGSANKPSYFSAYRIIE